MKKMKATVLFLALSLLAFAATAQDKSKKKKGSVPKP
jgi:hypothetical protein